MGRNFPTRPLFGDTHLHTSASFDAGMFGARLGPAEAYRFAKGEEDNFFGKTASAEPGPERWAHPFIKNQKTGVTILGWETQAAGYAAVWAQENTRESIFDAMQRRETYATTGPRMAVRLFGGWEFEAADAMSRSPAMIGYSKGVPTGGDLEAAPAGKAPTFLVAALDRLRREALRCEDAEVSPDDDDRTRLHVADLVNAMMWLLEASLSQGIVAF